jgi:hypothetical protein
MANPKVPTIVNTVVRSWALEDGTPVRPVSNPEEYAPELIIKVKDLDAKKSYVRVSDYVAPVRVSAGEDDLVAAAILKGIPEEVARELFREAKAIRKSK